MLREDGELLPVTCDQDKLTLFNCTRVIDAVDEDRSVLSRFKDGRIMTIDSLELRREMLPSDVTAFRLSSQPKGRIYLSQAIVDAARAAKLVRCDFELVWEEDSYQREHTT